MASTTDTRPAMQDEAYIYWCCARGVRMGDTDHSVSDLLDMAQHTEWPRLARRLRQDVDRLAGGSACASPA